MNHWRLHARSWSLVGPPLRPSAEDVRIVEDELAAPGRALDVAVLGVTPELVAMRLPRGSTVTAIEREPAMIEALFRSSAPDEPRDRPTIPLGDPRADFEPARDQRAVVGEWLSLPAPDGAFDVVVGDGSLSLLSYPTEYRAVAAELVRVVRPGGRVIVRLFAAPAQRESLAAIANHLSASFDALKWRIAMAIAHPNVAVVDILTAFERTFPDRAALAAVTGWRREVIDHVDVYRGSDAHYSFPTLREVRHVLAPLVEVAWRVPAYELGERCPTLILRVPSA